MKRTAYIDCPHCHARQTWAEAQEGQFLFKCGDCRRFFMAEMVLRIVPWSILLGKYHTKDMEQLSIDLKA